MMTTDDQDIKDLKLDADLNKEKAPSPYFNIYSTLLTPNEAEIQQIQFNTHSIIVHVE